MVLCADGQLGEKEIVEANMLLGMGSDPAQYTPVYNRAPTVILWAEQRERGKRGGGRVGNVRSGKRLVRRKIMFRNNKVIIYPSVREQSPLPHSHVLFQLNVDKGEDSFLSCFFFFFHVAWRWRGRNLAGIFLFTMLLAWFASGIVSWPDWWICGGCCHLPHTIPGSNPKIQLPFISFFPLNFPFESFACNKCNCSGALHTE